MNTRAWVLIGMIGIVEGVLCDGLYATASEASMTVQVLDEMGSPMTNVPVKIAYDDVSSKDGLTDTNGMFSFSGPYRLRGVAFARQEGYYAGQSDYISFKQNAMGRGEPWNPTVIIALKKRINPHPMAYGWIPNIPIMDKPCEYDFLASDWLPPHGTGQVCDITLTMKGWFRKENATMLFDGRVIAEFSGWGNGMISYKGMSMHASRIAESQLRSPQEAPENGYLPWEEWFMGSGPYTNETGKIDNGYYGNLSHAGMGNNYLIRIRTETNENGSIKSARYGKIEDLFIDWHYDGQWRLCGRYYMNTTATRNIEHLMGENMEKNILLRAWPGPSEAYDADEGKRWNEELKKINAGERPR